MKVTTNEGLICPECANERHATWQAENKDTVIQPYSYCKLRFELDGFTEHMWVEVRSIDDTIIKGVLANEPALITRIQYGDTVEFTRDEIEQHIPVVPTITIQE